MNAALAVAAGAALGALARYAVAVLALGAAPLLPVLGTLVANAAGSFLIGLYFRLGSPSPNGRLFVMTGFCGGFTTFSIFSVETVMLALEGRIAAAALLAGLSLVVWLAAVAAGDAVGRRIAHRCPATSL